LAELGDTLVMLGEYTLADESLRRAEGQLARFGYTLEEQNCTLLRTHLYCYLGAYQTARQWLARVFQNPILQDSAWLTLVARLTSATLASQTGDYTAVVADTTAALQVSERLGTPLLQVSGLILLGHAYAALAQWAAAEQPYVQARALAQQLANPALDAEACAGLALVALAGGKPAHAFTQIEALLPRLQNNGAVGLHEPFFVYLATYRVLHAVEDPRAVAVLTAGYAELQRYATGIADPVLRQSFWEAVPIHRALQQLHTAME